MSDLHRTLTDLEGKDWGPPTYDSHLVTECHRLAPCCPLLGQVGCYALIKVIELLFAGRVSGLPHSFDPGGGTPNPGAVVIIGGASGLRQPRRADQ